MIRQFFKDADGQYSSKRLGFITTLTTALVSIFLALILFAKKGEYGLMIDLINATLFSAYIFGGLVAADLFKYFKKK